MWTEAERASVIDCLAETRTALLQAIESFPAEHFSTCPGEGRWSAAQTFEHIVAVEGRALGRIQLAMSEPADPSRRSAMSGKDEELWSGVRSRNSRIQAPALLHPAGSKSRDELILDFETARQATLQFASDTQGDLRGRCARHPMFGDLDCYQWLMLIPAHGERHRAQIEEILSALKSIA